VEARESEGELRIIGWWTARKGDLEAYALVQHVKAVLGRDGKINL
jgi:hypothetical protein